jgi:hypothetical protein
MADSKVREGGYDTSLFMPYNKKTDWTGPHPIGLTKGEKESKSQEGRAYYLQAISTDFSFTLSNFLATSISFCA